MTITLLFFINKILASAVILSQIFLIAYIIYFFILKKKEKKVEDFFAQNSIKFVFLISLVSTFGSLFYSNIIGFIPCDLCWFQRIFMYPLVIISAVALLKKDDRGICYVIYLSVIGFLISLWAIMEHFGVSLSCVILRNEFNDACWIQDVQARVFATLGQPN